MGQRMVKKTETKLQIYDYNNATIALTYLKGQSNEDIWLDNP